MVYLHACIMENNDLNIAQKLSSSGLCSQHEFSQLWCILIYGSVWRKCWAGKCSIIQYDRNKSILFLLKHKRIVIFSSLYCIRYSTHLNRRPPPIAYYSKKKNILLLLVFFFVVKSAQYIIVIVNLTWWLSMLIVVMIIQQ